jgi:voltage-gated potassium channel
VSGALWYWLVEGFVPLDAIFMAVTTITTVGYREVQPLDTSGKIFTMGFIFVGVGLLFYTVVALVESVIVGEVAEALGVRRRSRKVRGLERHHILCGFGRVGQAIAEELQLRKVEFVIIDRDPQQQLLAREQGYLSVLGDATEDAVLREAGVPRARVLIAAADSDAGNTFVTLGARALNPHLTIIARAASDSGARRMIAAGATSVISPYQIAGHRMALAAVEDEHVAVYFGPGDGTGLVEVVVATQAGAGKSVSSTVAGAQSVHVLAVRRGNGQLVSGPSADYALQAGDRLMLYGIRAEIDALCADEGLEAIHPPAAPDAPSSAASVVGV